MKESAGTLLYRFEGETPEVLLVCPSGPAARYGWSIPKGLPEANENLESAARRETKEETGCVAGELTYLGCIQYRKSRKTVHAYAGTVATGEPGPGSWEVSDAKFVSLEDARRLLHPDQRVFVDRLEEFLSAEGVLRGHLS